MFRSTNHHRKNIDSIAIKLFILIKTKFYFNAFLRFIGIFCNFQVVEEIAQQIPKDYEKIMNSEAGAVKIVKSIFTIPFCIGTVIVSLLRMKSCSL